MSDAYTALIEDTCRQLGIDDPKPLAESGVFVIDGVDVYMDYRDAAFEASVVIYAELGTVGEDASPEMLRNLLEANLLWAGTGGATIGLHPDTRAAVLAYSMPFEGLTGTGVAAAMAQFAQVAAFWREAIAAGGGGGQGGSGSNPGQIPPIGPGGLLRV